MGDPEEGEVELAPVKQISASKVDMMGPIPYTALQALADPLNPPHLNNHWKNQFMDDLKDETVEAVRKYSSPRPHPSQSFTSNTWERAYRRSRKRRTHLGIERPSG